MKGLLVIICLVLKLNLVLGQPKLNFQDLKNLKEDTVKCNHILEACTKYLFINNDTFLFLAEQLELTADKIGSSKYKVSALNNKSIGYKFKGEYGKALELALKALEENEKNRDNPKKAIILLNYADILRQQKHYIASEERHLEGIRLSEVIKDSVLMAKFRINLALLYTNMKKYNEASKMYKDAIKIVDKVPDLYVQGMTARINMGQLASLQNNHIENVRLAKEVYEYAKAANDYDHLSLATSNIGHSLIVLGRNEEAIFYLKEGEVAARKYKSPQNLLYTVGNLSDAYKNIGDYKSAYENALIYIGLKDSLRNAQYNKDFSEISTKYETSKKESKIAEQQLELQNQKNSQRLVLIFSLVLIGGLILWFLFIRKKQNLKRKEAELLAEKARFETQIEHAEVEKLREMDLIKSTFFANISHEFRTPLTLIISPIEKMLSGNLSGDTQKYLGIIHRNAERLLTLVNQLLDLSKLESGKLSLGVSPGDLPKFIRAVAGSFESLADKKQINFLLEIENIDESSFFDHDVIEKILINLISNAFKFTDSEGQISVKLFRSDPFVKIRIKDSGIGIPADQLKTLFERFTHSSASDLQAGSGIGMALTKELVELHKGSIEVISNEGLGSEFIVTLNVHKNNFDQSEIASEKINYSYKTIPLTEIESNKKEDVIFSTNADKKPCLLIAEDNEDVRAFIKDICKADYVIIEADNGADALDFATELMPDIIITDVMMPKMDGYELCRRLKSDDKTNHIPIVMLTARADNSDKIEGLSLGADDYLIKPFGTLELLTRLKNLIHQRRQLHEHFRKVLHAFSPELTKEKSMDTRFLQNVRSVIEMNMDDETFGVTELSDKIGLSRSQLHRKLSSLTGLSPNEVIRNMRLQKAKILIEQKTGTIAEIAYRCGFNSPAYFSKCFRDYYGITPAG